MGVVVDSGGGFEWGESEAGRQQNSSPTNNNKRRMNVNTLSKYYYAYLGSLITILSGEFATAECCLSQLVIMPLCHLPRLKAENWFEPR